MVRTPLPSQACQHAGSRKDEQLGAPSQEEGAWQQPGAPLQEEVAWQLEGPEQGAGACSPGLARFLSALRQEELKPANRR
jgi:hypothetical protein